MAEKLNASRCEGYPGSKDARGQERDPERADEGIQRLGGAKSVAWRSSSKLTFTIWSSPGRTLRILGRDEGAPVGSRAARKRVWAGAIHQWAWADSYLQPTRMHISVCPQNASPSLTCYRYTA